MRIALTWNHPSYRDAEINEPIERVLSTNIMMSMATVHMRDDGVPESWINSMYFAYTEDLIFYILTYPTAEHVHNLMHNPSVALAIASQQPPDKHKVGLQIGGTCVPVPDDELAVATKVYAERFPWLRDFVRSAEDWQTTSLVSRLYKVTPRRIKVFSERQIGTEMWLELHV